CNFVDSVAEHGLGRFRKSQRSSVVHSFHHNFLWTCSPELSHGTHRGYLLILAAFAGEPESRIAGDVHGNAEYQRVNSRDKWAKCDRQRHAPGVPSPHANVSA